MGHDHQRERWLPVRHGEPGGNLHAIPGLVGDELHVRQRLARQQRLLAADDAEPPVLEKVVGAGIPRPGIADHHRVAVPGAARDPDVVGVGHNPANLLARGPLQLVEELVVEPALVVGDPDDPVGMFPTVRVAHDAGDIDIRTPVHGLVLAGVHVVGPHPRGVVAPVGDDEQLVAVVDVESRHAEVLETVLAVTQDVPPAFLAELAVVPDVLVGAFVETPAEPGISLAVEFDLAKGDLAADQELLGAPAEVEFPIGERPESSVQLRPRPVAPAFGDAK